MTAAVPPSAPKEPALRQTLSATARRPTAPLLIALLVSLAGLITFASLSAGVGEWVEGREAAVVLPWALPAVVVSAAAAGASINALRTRRRAMLALVLAMLVAVSLAALVLVNPPLAQPIP